MQNGDIYYCKQNGFMMMVDGDSLHILNSPISLNLEQGVAKFEYVGHLDWESVKEHRSKTFEVRRLHGEITEMKATPEDLVRLREMLTIE